MRRLRLVCLVGLVCASSAVNAVADNKSEGAQEFARGLAAMSRGDLDDASRRFEAVVALDPQSFEAHNNLAVIYTEQGKYEMALVELRKVVELKPDYYRGRKNLAELYARMAHEAFLEAAAFAPVEEKERLNTRARLVGAPPGSAPAGAVAGGMLETAGGASPAAAPEAVKAAPPAKVEQAAAPPPTAAPAVPVAAVPASAADNAPAELIALTEGVPAIALTDSGMRLYRQLGTTIQPAERIAVKQPPKLPASAVLYVAVPAEGRLELVPVERGGSSLVVRDVNGGKADVVIDAHAFSVLQEALQPYLSPAVVGASLRPADVQISQPKRVALREAFNTWAKSWQTKNLDGYLASYVADYNPRGGPGAQKWREQRGKVFERSGDITIKLSDPVILDAGGDRLVTLTKQEYTSKLQSSIGVKKLSWTPTPQGWRITGEEMLSEKIQKTPG